MGDTAQELFVSLLLFPVTLYYFSPALILQGASEGIINASFIVFALMFLSALFVGRLWCGWACPAGALQECGQPINNKPTPGGKFNWIKWAIWIPWIGLIVALAVGAGGYRAVEPLYQLETGVTMTLPLDDRNRTTVTIITGLGTGARSTAAMERQAPEANGYLVKALLLYRMQPNAALHGLLERVRDLSLILVSVNRIEPAQTVPPTHSPAPPGAASPGCRRCADPSRSSHSREW